MNLVNVGRVAIALDDEPNCPKGIIGVVVRKQFNTFLGKPTVTVVWENDSYYDYSEDDLGIEFDLFEVKTKRLEGLDFSGDREISDSIRSNLFKELLLEIRKSLSTTEATQ